MLSGLSGLSALAACGGTSTAVAAPLPPLSPGLRAASGSVMMFPPPGSRTAAPHTAIALRGSGLQTLQASALRVTGSATGRHAGRLIRHSDGGGVSFVPSQPFRAGETVAVVSALSIRGRDAGGTSRFAVCTPATETTPPSTASSATPTPSVSTFVSDPEVKSPTLTIAGDTSGSGLIALATKGAGLPSQLVLFRPDGSVVWQRTISGNAAANDLKLQQWKGEPVLTWWQGTQQAHGYGIGTRHILDTRYAQVAEVSAANGLSADLHDMQLTGRATALVTAYSPVRWDLRPYGGSRNGIVLDSIVQEVDVATGQAVFEWHALDHVAPSLSYAGAPTDSTTAWDFFHVNSIDEGSDGSLLVSSRHTSALWSLDHVTGDVVWKLGGKQSDLTMPAATRFFFQHDARWQADGTITLFDDEGGPPRQAKSSRGLRLKVDASARRVSLAQSYTPATAVTTNSQGNVQQLANGNVMVGWGDQPQLTEFTSGGKVVWNALMPTGVSSYRAFRIDWSGAPTTVPKAAVVTRGKTRTAYVSWNGDTRTARWRLLATGANGTPKVVAEVAAKGYETAIAVPHGAKGLRIAAVDSAGKVLNTVRVT